MRNLTAQRETEPWERSPSIAAARVVVAFALLWDVLIITMEVTLHNDSFFALPNDRLLHDFAYFWGGAKLFWLGRLDIVFDPHLFATWLATQVAPGSMQQFATWSYPPTTLLALLPIGLLPLSVAVLLWDFLLPIVLGTTLRLAAPSRLTLLVILAGPAALYSLYLSQNGGLTASLFIATLWLLDRRPIWAGICAGLFVIKPQLGLLLPFALAAGGYWRSFAAAAAVAAAMVAASIAVFGIGAWEGFIYHTAPEMTAQLRHAWGIPPQFAMPTTWVALQSMGAGTGIASLGQTLSTLTAIGLVTWVWRRRGTDPRLRNALTCCLPLLATPFGYIYDATPATLAIAILAVDGFRRGFPKFEGPVLAVTWLWLAVGPILCRIGLPSLGAPLLLALAACLVYRIRRGDDLEAMTTSSCSTPSPSAP